MLFVFQFRELKNELIKKIKSNFMVVYTSMVCMLLTSKFVSNPLRLSAVQWWKQLMYFNVYILAATFKLAEAAVVRFSPNFIPKIIHKFFKCQQKPWKTKVKEFILWSVGRTIPIMWNTFSSSNKFLPLCWTYPR